MLLPVTLPFASLVVAALYAELKSAGLNVY